MNSLESLLSFLILASILPLLIPLEPFEVDTTHYNLKLAEDSLRIIYLKEGLSLDDEDDSKFNKISEEIALITDVVVESNDDEIYLSGHKRISEADVVVERIVFINGEPQIISIKFGTN